ncbi:MAG: UDP-2,4-diacetamido-2,4,6-trideoxy-beta-L-altropyranose hydrolase [Lachnospiraceae bacterium]|nr:UDP-2,4-diacetamido-2,4,6-trideoxy-beta-L-altropyranose hydrolase [Lachnospiraceae bacterium]
MLYIRVDGNEKIATGHVMRCLSIAKALRSLGEESVFILAESYGVPIIEKEGFKAVCINGSYDKITEETEKMDEMIASHRIQKLLVDSYFIDETYLEHLRRNTSLIYIDDIGGKIYPADILINYCNYYDRFRYKERYGNTDTKLLLGCSYAPLREEFSHRRERQFDEFREILITTGGTDGYNMAYRIGVAMAECSTLRNIKIHIVSGRFNTHLSELRELESRAGNIVIHHNAGNMAELMMNCDAAVSAGGTTLYEICYCGLPTVCFAFADNQLDGTGRFGEEEVMINAGDIRKNPDRAVRRIVDNICRLAEDSGLRRRFSDKMWKLVDGNGALRIAKEIQAL